MDFTGHFSWGLGCFLAGVLFVFLFKVEFTIM